MLPDYGCMSIYTIPKQKIQMFNLFPVKTFKRLILNSELYSPNLTKNNFVPILIAIAISPNECKIV